MTTHFVVMRICAFEFESVGLFSGIHPEIKMEKGTVGYLQVFDTMENAQAVAEEYTGETDILQITTSEPKG